MDESIPGGCSGRDGIGAGAACLASLALTGFGAPSPRLLHKLPSSTLHLPTSAFGRNARAHLGRHTCLLIPAPAEEVLLDENEEAKKHKFYMVGGFEESPDHRWGCHPRWEAARGMGGK